MRTCRCMTISAAVVAAELACVAALGTASNTDPAVDRIVAAARTDNRAASHARYLAGDIGARLTGSANLARAEKWARDRFEAFGLTGARLEAWGAFDPSVELGRKRSGSVRGARTVHNVVAELRGSERPDEFVIVGAHLDSWDFAHGAADNAAGCGAVMEAARLLVAAGVTPKRTIRFVLWTGEEQGLLGSKAYVKAHANDLPTTSAVLVMDAGTNPVSGLVGTRAMQADLERALAPIATLDRETPFRLAFSDGLALPDDCCSTPSHPSQATCTGGTASCTARAGQTGGCPSDHTPFLAAGVPAFLLEQTGPADYARTHHTEFDTVDALLPSAIEHSALVIALAAHRIAELPGLLSRDGLIASPAVGGGPALAPRACTPSCQQ